MRFTLPTGRGNLRGRYGPCEPEQRAALHHEVDRLQRGAVDIDLEQGEVAALLVERIIGNVAQIQIAGDVRTVRLEAGAEEIAREFVTRPRRRPVHIGSMGRQGRDAGKPQKFHQLVQKSFFMPDKVILPPIHSLPPIVSGPKAAVPFAESKAGDVDEFINY